MPVELNLVESVTELDTTVIDVILESASTPGPAGPGVPTGGTVNQVLTKDSSTDYDTSWQDPMGGAGGAPDDVDYLVGTASGELSAEIVVGTAPGGELGGTWASPTVDATHSGSSHAAVQAAAEATAAAALSAHLTDTTDAHDATAISFTPAGTIAATDVQAAIEEVATEAGGGGAPTTADYLVGTAQGGLSAEIVVGTSPGGELGGTWASPTVDATHSGSSHAGVQAAAEATAAAALAGHTGDTSDAHDASAISVDSTTLSGTATDVQASLEEIDNLLDDHSARHENGGADEISLAGLSGVGADMPPSTRTLTAGVGLAGGGDLSADRTFSVNVDDSTIEINVDTLRVKDAGVTPAKLSEHEFQIIVTDPNGDALTTGDGKAPFLVPARLNGKNLTGVYGAVTTVSSSGIPTIQIRNATQAADMLSTKLTIDANENTSFTAAAAAVIDTANDDVVTGDLLFVDIDVAGTGAKGLIVGLIFGV